MGQRLDAETEDFLVYVVKDEFRRLSLEKSERKLIKTQVDYVKNLQRVDEYITHLKSLDFQTGWLFNLPKTNIKRNRISKKHEVVTHYIPEYFLKILPPLPRMCMWAPIHKNVIVEDENILHHVPYIGDDVVNDDDWQNELLEFYENRVHMPADDYMTDDVLSDLVDVLVSKAWSKDNKPLPMSIRGPAEPFIIDKELAFELISYYIVDYAFSPEDLKEKYDDYQRIKNKEAIYRETIPNIDGNQATVYTREKALNSFQTLFCRRCFLYDCIAHVFYPPIYKPEEEDFSRYNGPCGKDCFINIDSGSREFIPIPGHLQDEHPKISLSSIKTGHFTFSEKTLFNVLARTFQRNFCSIARTLGSKTCAEVYIHFHNLREEDKDAIKKQIFEDRKLANTNKKKKFLKGKATSIWSKHFQKFKEKENATTEEDRAQKNYMPCDHEGLSCSEEIGDKCECFKRGTFCEKSCNCNPNCENRFPGCNCKGACNTKSCPCHNAARECDPDLCKTCGAAELDLMERRDKFKCSNVSMQRSFHKHLLLGPSEVSGWGVYLNGIAIKDELISEYCGETISQEEADRRGKVYDKHKASFLFNLNGDQVVDAKRKGNKIRFANHSVNANCKAIVKMVNGDYRIGIFANRNIDKYEELFFDYRYGPNDRLNFVCIERPSNKSCIV